MLTTTVDGLWVLQVLSGIEVVAPELGLRPHLPRAESRSMALAHPAARELLDAQVITADGEVDAAVVEWMSVLSRRDMAVLLCAQTPGAAGPDRISLARLARWWVCLERHDSLVRLSSAGVATTEADAGVVIGAQIDRLCGELRPAGLRPLSIEVGPLLSGVRDGGGLGAFLTGRRLEPEQARILSAAADTRRSAQASLVAVQAGDRNRIAPGTVTIIDTPDGRLLSEQVVRDGRAWMIIGPGSAPAIAAAVRTMLRQTPARTDWHCHRKVVDQ